MKPEVGNTITIVWNRNSGLRTGTMEDYEIIRVGRRWVTFKRGHAEGRYEVEGEGEGPFDIDAGGYSSPGMAFMTREAAETWLARVRLWDGLRDFMRTHRPPDTLTLEDLTLLTQRMNADDD